MNEYGHQIYLGTTSEEGGHDHACDSDNYQRFQGQKVCIHAVKRLVTSVAFLLCVDTISIKVQLRSFPLTSPIKKPINQHLILVRFAVSLIDLPAIHLLLESS